MAPPTPNLQNLVYRVGELERDVRELQRVVIDVAVMKNDVRSTKSLVKWLIGVLATFAVALMIAAVTFALNAFQGAPH